MTEFDCYVGRIAFWNRKRREEIGSSSSLFSLLVGTAVRPHANQCDSEIQCWKFACSLSSLRVKFSRKSLRFSMK